MTYPDGRTLSYNYSGSTLDNATSRISSISDNSGTLQSYAYQGADAPMTMIDGNGVELGITQDAFGQTSEQDWSKGGSSIDDNGYTYDNDGNVLSKTDNVHSANSETFTYDNLNRVTSFTRADGASASYNLDAVGNTSSTVITPSPSTPSTISGTTTRTNNAQNQIVTDGNATLDYDADGNTTGDENGNTLVYDAWNRLMTVSNLAGQPIASYSYDALGRRITQTQHATTDASVALTSGTSTTRVLTVGALTYMVTTDAAHGSELWVTDGTPASTHLLDDIDPGTASSNPGSLKRRKGVTPEWRLVKRQHSVVSVAYAAPNADDSSGRIVWCVS
jgi:ELWxxDGT repeat protein/YD repeat-containing protein